MSGASASAGEPVLREYYADLHIHLGWAGNPGGGVKISAARDLTLAGILHECQERKGIQIAGVIDAATTGALADLEALLSAGVISPLPCGGLGYRDEVTLIPGAEVEVVHGPSRRPLHLLCYLPGLAELQEFAAWQRGRVRNPALSTQRHHNTSASDVVRFVGGLGGIVIPAHIFTPFKSVLSASEQLAAVVDPALWCHLPAVELGLSADTELADQLPELAAFSFVSNSDAHSLGKIAREHNALRLARPDFAELVLALQGAQGRGVAANYGLSPQLGKYHRTYCLTCDERVAGDPPVLSCARGEEHRLVLGVLDRIACYRERGEQAEAQRPRPPYIPQVPLQFVPGLGKRSLDRLIAAFGSEMAVLHRAVESELAEVVGVRMAALISRARAGTLAMEPGAGGIYGRILAD